MADSFQKTLYVYESRFMNERETTVRLMNEEEERSCRRFFLDARIFKIFFSSITTFYTILKKGPGKKRK